MSKREEAAEVRVKVEPSRFENPCAVDKHGNRLVRIALSGKWHRLTPARERLIEKTMKWLGWVSTGVCAIILPSWGWSALAVSVGASMAVAWLAHAALLRGLEVVPAADVRWVERPPRPSPLSRNPVVYRLSLMYLAGLAVCSVYFIFDGEVLFGSMGALVLSWASLELIRERRARTEAVQSRLRSRD